MSRLQREAAPLKKAEEEAMKAWNIVEKKMNELGGRLNETNRAANDIVKKNEREANKLDEIKVRVYGYRSVSQCRLFSLSLPTHIPSHHVLQ